MNAFDCTTCMVIGSVNYVFKFIIIRMIQHLHTH